MISSITDDIISSVISRFGDSLTKLNLSNNGLRSIENIDRISSRLERLNISENCLVDIRPLSKLACLRHLDVSSNDISDIQIIGELDQLQSLDLRFNKLVSLSTLECLSNLTNLVDLNLNGNPLCSSIGYPSSIYALLPQLKYLDGQSKESLRKNNQMRSPDDAEETVSKKPNMVTSLEFRPSNRNHEVLIENNTAHLEAQLKCMEHAFELQELVLAGDTGDENQRLLGFPYLTVLQLWRRQAVDALTQLSLARQTICFQSTELKQQRVESAKALKESQMNALSWRQRSLAAAEKATASDVRCSELHTIVERSKHSLLDMEAGALNSRKLIHNLRSFLECCVAEVSEKHISSMLAIEKAVEKLESQKMRLKLASERIAFSAVLVAQREVQLRNSAAMQEVMNKHMESDFSDEDESLKKLLDDKKGISRGSTDSFYLRPEAEALLRSLFCRLDINDSGVVSCEVLLSCIDPASDSDSRANGDSECESLSLLLKEVLGQIHFTNLLTGLRSSDSADLTWGEFLLLFKQNKKQDLEELTFHEEAELHDIGAWGDVRYGMVPLDFSSFHESVDRASIDTVSCYPQELQRLSKERAALLVLVRKLNSSLKRRAEICKKYFLDKSKNVIFQLDRARAQLKNLEEKIETLEARLEFTSNDHSSEISNFQSRLDAAHEEIALINRELSEERLKQSTLTDNMVIIEKSKYDRIEHEYDLMQSEVGRKDVLVKGLERDVRRLSNSVLELTEDKLNLQEELTLCKQQLEKLTMQHEASSIKARREAEEKHQLLEIEVTNMKAELAAAIEAKLLVEERNSQLASAFKEVPVTGAPLEATDCDEFNNGRTVKALREEMQKIKDHPTESTLDFHAISERGNVQSGQAQIYASHLEKLLKLAEEAISGAS